MRSIKLLHSTEETVVASARSVSDELMSQRLTSPPLAFFAGDRLAQSASRNRSSNALERGIFLVAE